MRLDKLTIKSQEALGEAQSLAGSRGHAEILPAHLLRALLGQPEGSTVPVLQKLGIRIDALQDDVEQLLEKLPKASGGAQSAARALHLARPGSRHRRGQRAEGRVRLDRASAARARERQAGPGRQGAARRRRRARGAAQGARFRARRRARHGSRSRVEVPGAREVRTRPHRRRAPGQDRPRDRPRRGDPSRRSRCSRAGPRTTRC